MIDWKYVNPQTSCVFRNQSPPCLLPSRLSLHCFLEPCRARVGGVSSLFGLAGCSYSLCRHLVFCTKTSPTITRALSDPGWKHFTCKILKKQNVCEWNKYSGPNSSNGSIVIPFITYSIIVHKKYMFVSF